MTKAYLRILKISILMVLLLPVIIILSSSMLKGETQLQILILRSWVYILAAGVLFYLTSVFLNRKNSLIKKYSILQARYIDKIPLKKADMAIFLATGCSLFLELTIIRWQSAVFPIFAFYKNYSLLSCFMGLGLGYALAKRKSIPLLFTLPVLAFQILYMIFLRYGLDGSSIFSLLKATPFIEQLDMGLKVSKSIPHFISIYSFLITTFLITALIFVPVGQLCGRLMARRKNLRAYGMNLLGSIAGTVLSIGLSFLWTPPVIWFSITFIILIIFQVFDSKLLLTTAISSFTAIIILAWPVDLGFEKIYSPYQLLERGPGVRGLSMIRAAGHFYQRIHDLSPGQSDPEILKAGYHYDLPYRFYSGILRNVAVLGAGTGNDVAAALRAGAKNVDAVEIDPGILKLGKIFHPEEPYKKKHVNNIVDDARTHMRQTDKKYDMVVYGLLDSHSLLSFASSIRLDSYVYTIEGFKESREKLKKNGIMSLSFCVISPMLGRKIFLMMKQAFDGNSPVCLKTEKGFRVTFLQNKNGTLVLKKSMLKGISYRDVTDIYADPNIKADVSTDDWPFFYMPRRVYPVSYLGILLLILLLSAGITYNFFKQELSFSRPAFFFLGAGFMLVETKAITELGLCFGNTWHVIGIVIAGILLMAFLANLVVLRYKISKPFIPFILLILSLALGYFFSIRGGLGSSIPAKLATLVLLTCPIFFSGMVFSSMLSRARDITGVMAINLLGAMLGGILEYNSMYFGFSSLYILAIFLYLMAMLKVSRA